MFSNKISQPLYRQEFCINQIHDSDWHSSIVGQLHRRKRVEQDPFEGICSFACIMFDRVDIQKSENIQLSLQKERLQQELHEVERAILAGRSDAAKAILSNISHLEDGSISSDGLKRQHSSLSNEKTQLEKKIIDLQEKLNDTLKNKSDTAQKIIDLKSEIEEKELHLKQSNHDIANRDKIIAELQDQCRAYQERLNNLDETYKTLHDEHIALSLSNKSLEKKHLQLKMECENLRVRILEVKKEDADRLNAENEKMLLRQQEKIKKGIEANLSEMNKAEAARIAAHDPAAIAVAAMNLGDMDLDDDDVNRGAVSRIPAEVLLVFDAHDGEVDAVNWLSRQSMTDDYLATGGTDRKVKLWKVVDNHARNTAVLLGSNASITSIDVDNDVLLASSNDMASRIWSLSDYKLRRTLTGHSAKVLSAKFLGASNKIASGSNDRTLKIWDINRNACTRTYFSGSTCNDLIYYNHLVISGHFDKKIRYWDLKSANQEPIDECALQSKITSLDINREGNLLLCSVRDDTLKTLDLRTKQVLHTYSAEGFKIGVDYCRAKFSTDGSLIACGSSDGSIYIWSTHSSKLEKTLKADHGNNAFVACSWCPDRKRLVSIERSKRVTVWS